MYRHVKISNGISQSRRVKYVISNRTFYRGLKKKEGSGCWRNALYFHKRSKKMTRRIPALTITSANLQIIDHKLSH